MSWEPGWRLPRTESTEDRTSKVKHKISWLTLATIVFGFLAGGAASAPSERARQAIEKSYARFDQANMARDSSVLQGLIQAETTRDFVARRPDYEDTREQWVLRLKRQTSRWEPAREARTELKSLMVRGNTAIALARGKLTLVSTKPETTGDPSGKAHTFVTYYTNRDTWVQSAGRWKRKQSETLESTTFKDGKLVRRFTGQNERAR